MLLDLLYATCLCTHTFFNRFLHGFLFSVAHAHTHILLSVDANWIFRWGNWLYVCIIVVVRTGFNFHTHASCHSQLHLALVLCHPHGITARLRLLLTHLLLLDVVLDSRIGVVHHAAEA